MPDLKKAAENLKAGAQNARNTKSTRLWFMVGLVVMVFALWWLNIIKTGFAIGLGIILLAAIGIETMNYDLDLGKLWETGSISESRVSHTKDGIKLMGSCAIPIKGDGDLNCSNFSSQSEAQAKYDQCADEIASYNDGIDASKIKSLDIYRLDGDKDGTVCEALPGAPTKIEASDEKTEEASTETKKATTKKAPPPKKTESSTNTYSKTPILNSSEPYPISEATVKTNPKVLPVQ
jgi:hypothetical protein